VNELTEAYIYLRNLEHRLMYLEDAQTQELPKSEASQALIAKAMNFDRKSEFGWSAFLAKLDSYRQQVQRHFDETFEDADAGGTELEAETAIWNGAVTETQSVTNLQGMGYQDAAESLRRLVNLHQGARYKQLPELSRQRFDAVMPHVISQAAKCRMPMSRCYG